MAIDSIETFRNVYDFVALPVVLKDDRLTIVYANKAYAGLFGFDDRDLIGTDGLDAYCQDARDVIQAHDRRVIATGEEEFREFELRVASGEFRLMRATKKRVRFAGKPYVFTIIGDPDPC